jgi:LysM repeat protein
MRPTTIPTDRMRGGLAAALSVPFLLAGACGPANRSSAAPDARAATTAASAQAAEMDSLEEASDPTYAGLDKVYPEIVQLETWYREALQAVWNDDLEVAEQRAARLDSALAQIDDDENPVAGIYFQSLGTRLDKLKDLILEERTLQRYLAKVDSLSVVSPDGGVDSTALSTLIERPVGARPASPRYDLQLVENAHTERWQRFFAGDGRHYMDLWLTRLPKYQDLIWNVLDEYNVPRDLVFLAMIESGLSLQARSYANAVGPWQFIAGTGKLYDLRIDWWVDERRNLEKATRAAASHLSDLYEQFDSWPLALAAYNCGSRRVERAIARHKTRDFWKLTTLPSQTRNYVPKFMAALYIGKDPRRFAFTPPSGERYTYDVVPVEDATDMRLIAELAECPLEQILELNPYVKRWCTPPSEKYDVRVPVGKGAQVVERLGQVPAEERVTWRRHRVVRGETLTGLAKQYSTSVQAIRDANKLGTRKTLKPGTYVIIPVISVGEPGPRVAQYIAEAAKSASATAGTTSRGLSYKVRRGDTLSSISRRHGVSVSQIMKWNRKRSARIFVGERLRLHARSNAD